MEKLINKQSVLEVAKGFTFTFAEERQRYMDFLEYCLDNAKDKSRPLTNADKIRNRTDEELAELIYKTQGCPVDDKVCYLGKGCMICITEWLKSEVEEK